MSTFAFYSTLTFFIVLCVFFALLILIQKGRGGGISSAFGGSGGNTAFGSKTGDVLTWATAVVFAIFLSTTVALNLLANKVDNEYRNGVQAEVAQPDTTNLAQPSAAPVATPTDNASPATAPASGPMSIVPPPDRNAQGIVEPAVKNPTTAPAR